MKISINKDKAEIVKKDEGANSGTINYNCVELEFDEAWEGLTKEAVLIPISSQEAIPINIIDNKFYLNVKKHGSYNIGIIRIQIK